MLKPLIYRADKEILGGVKYYPAMSFFTVIANVRMPPGSLSSRRIKSDRRWVCWFLMVSMILAPMPVYSLPVTGLYSERVAVANESDGERARAFREALSAVILKVTGDPRWLEHEAVRAALNNAQSYVEAISYSSEMVLVELPEQDTSADASETGSEASNEVQDSRLPADEQLEAENGSVAALDSDEASADQPGSRTVEQEQRYINLDFAENLINQLLVSADIPIWDSNRPSVLVWMVLQDPGGERSMLTADSNPEIIALMQDFADQRGVPIIFPVLDFEDRRALNEDQVWALEAEAIRNASARYGADSMLAGRVYFAASGEMVGLWQFIFQDREDVFDGVDSDLERYLAAPLNRITSELAGYFAITPEASLRENVMLRIDGVDGLPAYSALIAYLSNLGLVESVATIGLDGERIELSLGVIGNAMQLNELIALDRDLLPIRSASVASGPGSQPLHYRWTR